MAAMEQSLIEQYKDVYVFAQQVDNEISPIAFELLGKAKDLANDLNEKVVAVLLGHNVKDLAAQLGAYGADKVIVVDDKELEVYRTEPYTHALASVINEFKPEIMLVGATAIGRDLGPRVSARVQTGLTADCTLLEIGDFPLNPMPGKEQKHNQLLMTRPAFGGNTIATIACPDNRPQMATVRPGVMQKIDPIADAKPEVIEYNPGFTPDNKYVEILDIVKNVPRYSGIRFTTAQPIRRSSGMKKKNSGTCFTPSAVPRMFRSVCPGCMEQPLALQQAGMAQNGCTAEHLRDLILSRDTIRSGHRRSSRQRVCITCMSPTSPAFQTIGSIRDGCCIILRQTSGTGDLKDGLISIPSA